MKRIRILISIFFLVAGIPDANAQSDGFKPVEDIAEFKIIFSRESKKVNSISSSFRQEKVLSLLEEKMISEGKFWFQRENKVRIEYQTPFQYLLIINHDEVIIHDHNKENRMNVRSNKLFQQVNRVILDCVQGSILNNNDFSVSAFENTAGFRLEMMPLSKGLKDFFTEIIVWVDKKDFTVTRLSLFEPGGDYTTIHFTNKTLNAKIPDSVFNPDR